MARPTKTKPTLKTIAHISGLTVATVSRALNDSPDIGQETKKLIRKIADEIGYVPNRAGVRLRTGRTNVISLVMSTEHDMMNHTARLISSVAGGLRDTPFHLIVTPFFPNEDPMKPVRYIVESGSADAVILNQIRPKDPRIAYLMERGFPFATHGRTDWAESHPYYDFDNAKFGEIALRKLAARGRQVVLALAPPRDQSYAQHMIKGMQDAAHAIDIDLRFVDEITSDTPSADVVAHMRALLAMQPEVDAIVTASTSSAMAVVGAIEANGLTLGDQIDVFSKEAMPFLNLFRNEILTISEKVDQTGDFLARAAIQAIKHPEEPPMQFLEVPEAN